MSERKPTSEISMIRWYLIVMTVLSFLAYAVHRING
jgi:hypothetical protein